MPKPAKRRLFAAIMLTIIVAFPTLLTAIAFASAQQENIAEHSDVLMKIIGGLLSLNVVVLTGFVGWLVSNQKELFHRVGAVETAVQVREKICDERHD